MRIQYGCTKNVQLCFNWPEQIIEVPFCLTEFLTSTELSKKACRISLYQGEQPDLLNYLKCVVRLTFPPHQDHLNVFRVLCKFGEVRRDKQGQLVLVALIKE